MIGLLSVIWPSPNIGYYIASGTLYPFSHLTVWVWLAESEGHSILMALGKNLKFSRVKEIKIPGRTEVSKTMKWKTLSGKYIYHNFQEGLKVWLSAKALA